jgi:hypothetical protein
MNFCESLEDNYRSSAPKNQISAKRRFFNDDLLTAVCVEQCHERRWLSAAACTA